MGCAFSAPRNVRPRALSTKHEPEERDAALSAAKGKQKVIDPVVVLEEISAPEAAPSPKRKAKKAHHRHHKGESGSGRRSQKLQARIPGSGSTEALGNNLEVLITGTASEAKPEPSPAIQEKDDADAAGETTHGDDGSESADDFVGDGAFVFDAEDEPVPHTSGCARTMHSNADVQCLRGDSDILQEQQRATSEIGEVLSLPASSAVALLKHFKWNKDRLLQNYTEDPVKVCKEAGVAADHVASRTAAPSASSAASICSICCETIGDSSSGSALSCGHLFCLDCWDQYLTTKVAQGETHITCPAVRCGLVVDDARIRRLARSPVVYERYVRFATKAFVDTNPAVRWCPAPGCGAAINALDVTKGAVACGCGFRFCFTCNREAHAPASCEQVKAWAAKCKDDSETTNWILANTMDCPGCRSAIEKNGGCNHVTCRQCHHEFCWVCRRPWKGHADFFQCNKYKKDAQPALTASGSGSGKRKKESQREKEAREREESRAALERYLHFYHRYLNHDKSRDFEQKIREMANNKMKELTETDATWLGVQFVKAAAEQLIVCRSMLKYSYIYSYYMPEGVAKNLFEYLQQALENTTEDLSAMLSLPAESLERVKCVNLTKLAECRAVGLLDAVEHGVTNTLEGFVTEANDSPVLSMAPAPSSSNASSPARRPPPSPALAHSALRATSPLANSSSSAAPVISNPRLVSPPPRTRLQPALSDASSSSATESSAPRPARSGGSGRPVS